jgi:hypothetical protein
MYVVYKTIRNSQKWSGKGGVSELGWSGCCEYVIVSTRADDQLTLWD